MKNQFILSQIKIFKDYFAEKMKIREADGLIINRTEIEEIFRELETEIKDSILKEEINSQEEQPN